MFSVEPRFDMREEAAVDLQPRPQRSHVLQSRGGVFGQESGIALNTEAEIVVAPNADRAGVCQKPARLFDSIFLMEQIAHVAKDDDLIDPFLAQAPQRVVEKLHAFVNIGNQTQFHDSRPGYGTTKDVKTQPGIRPQPIGITMVREHNL